MKSRLTFALVALALLAFGASAQITLVNVVPQARSGETNQDSEPTVAVNPANPLHLAASAFTWDNLNAGPMTGNMAPIYVSTDGGATWSMVLNVPSTTGAMFPTGDINPRFTASPSGTTSFLYTGILHSADFNMWVLRSADYRLAVAMTQIDTRSNNVDQPHLGGLMSLRGDAGADHIYVGFNDGWGNVSPTGMTASVDWTLNGADVAPTFNLNAVETRSTGALNQDGFSIVPTVHPDGTVYVGFYGWRSTPGGNTVNTDVVVVRDDHFGNDGYGSLIGAGALAGVQVVTAQPMQVGGFMGNNRLGASNMAICVDPNDSDRVYLVWGDKPPMTSNQTLHVRLSTDRGANWGSDLLTISNAVNPAIAVNTHGVAGLLYQTWGSNRWQSVFRRTNNAAGTTFDAGVVLADTDSTTPAWTFQPYIGDYTGLVARGRDFYGIFSASNYPDAANFPTVMPTYQRYVNWGTNQLFSDAGMTITVSRSIDPFFFHSVELDPKLDFYVRGGNFPLTNKAHRDFLIMNLLNEDEALGAYVVPSDICDPSAPLGSLGRVQCLGVSPDTAGAVPMFTPAQKEEIIVSVVDYLLELTDERVAFERAPFDHPEIFVPIDARASENVAGRGTVAGSGGYTLMGQTGSACTTPLAGRSLTNPTTPSVVLSDGGNAGPVCFKRVPATGAGGIATKLPNYLNISSGPRLVGAAADCGASVNNHYCH